MGILLWKEWQPSLLKVTQLGHWVHVLQLEVMSEASRIALALPFSSSNLCRRDTNYPSEFANKQRLHNALHLSLPLLPPSVWILKNCIHFALLAKGEPVEAGWEFCFSLWDSYPWFSWGLKNKEMSAAIEYSSRSERKGRLHFMFLRQSALKTGKFPSCNHISLWQQNLAPFPN